MPHMYPTPEPHALDMWSEAMEAPMPDLVTEPTEFPCGALFITVVSIVRVALAAVIMGESHLQMSLSFLGISSHYHLVQCWPLH